MLLWYELDVLCPHLDALGNLCWLKIQGLQISAVIIPGKFLNSDVKFFSVEKLIISSVFIYAIQYYWYSSSRYSEFAWLYVGCFQGSRVFSLHCILRFLIVFFCYFLCSFRFLSCMILQHLRLHKTSFHLFFNTIIHHTGLLDHIMDFELFLSSFSGITCHCCFSAWLLESKKSLPVMISFNLN